MTEYIILGLLALKDMTIYEIKKVLETRISLFFSPSMGSLHPCLQKLKAKGLVVSREDVATPRKRIIYSITKNGRDYFREWNCRPFPLERIKDSAMLRLFFFDKTPPNHRLSIIKDYLQEIDTVLAELKEIRMESEAKTVPEEWSETYKYQMETLLFGEQYYRLQKEHFTRIKQNLENE